MKKIWQKIEDWFEENASEVLKTFNAGATKEEIEQLLNVFDSELPKDFIKSYSIHNGQNTGLVFNSAIIDPETEGLSSIETIIRIYEIYNSIDSSNEGIEAPKGIKSLFWNGKWLPIMEDGFGNSYCIDMDPAEGGTVGQIILRFHEGPTYNLVSKSFKNWIKEYVDGNLD